MSVHLNGVFTRSRLIVTGFWLVWSTVASAQSPAVLAITTTSPLPSAAVGAPYSAPFSATGGVSPYHWNIASSLPAGLQFTQAGILSGVPSVAGTFTLLIQVVDSANASVVKTFSLPITSAPSQITISTVSPLPSGSVGAPYSQTFSATGGVAPYRWGGSGSLPPGLQLDSGSGTLSGTPAAAGAFSFTIQVADASSGTASKSFALTIVVAPLTFITQGPLFDATLGSFYSQNFQASGGTPPYTWAILSGPPPPALNFDSNLGALSGTPSTAGGFSLTIQVTDSAGVKASKTFNLTVSPPRLTITTPSPLPAGVAGASYSQRLSAAGGAPPYTWSQAGSVPGLQIDASSGVLSGTPSSAGAFTFTIQVIDSGATTSNKVFTLNITPGPLTLTTNTQLAGGTLGEPYSQQMAATGGAPPYSWSANGIPAGLTLDSSTGLISGTLQAAGSLLLTITATDSARATATNLFRITVGVPPAPPATLSGLPATSAGADQSTLSLSIGSPYPITISGQLTISFTPDVGSGDSTIQFATGGRTVSFTIPAGATDARFPVSNLGLQTGTVAGTITVAAQLTAGGADITASPGPSISTRVNRAAPVINSAKLIRSGSGFSIQIIGFSTTREITQASFRFKATGAGALQQSDIAVSVGDLFSKWYQDATSNRFGSQFTFTQPFTIQGDANGVTPDTVTLTNSIGSVSSPVN